MNSKERHTFDPAGLRRKPGLVCSHINENRKNRGNISTLMRYKALKTCCSTRFKYQWTEQFLKKLEIEDNTWLFQATLATFHFLEIQIISLEIFYHCGMYKVFPHATMSQQYNYYSQKFRLGKTCSAKTRDSYNRGGNNKNKILCGFFQPLRVKRKWRKLQVQAQHLLVLF